MAQRLRYLWISWPALWCLGIEQFAVPLYIVMEFWLLCITNKGRIKIPTVGKISIVLIFVWLLPIAWVNNFGLYFKSLITIVAQAMFIIVFHNRLNAPEDWWLIVRSFKVLAIYLGLGSIVFTSGLWDGEFVTVLGRFIPQSLADSNFFESIKYHSFGAVDVEDVLGGKRVTSFALAYSSLSMVCLILSPYMLFLTKIGSIAERCYGWACFILIVLTLFFTDSRLAILAFVVSISIYFMYQWWYSTVRNEHILGRVIIFFGCIAGLLILMIFVNYVIDALNNIFIASRASSAVTRLRIYEETLKNLPEHWIVGWGVSQPIAGTSKLYSMGTHSSILAMLFQHGIVGIAVYLGLWFKIWRTTLLVRRGIPAKFRNALGATFVAAILGFNIREVADVWWWDQLLCLVVWTTWGLIITAKRFENQRVGFWRL